MNSAFIFPGQGSQKVNMLSELAEQFSEITHTFQEASDALGFDLWAICQDADKLGQTAFTQPALLTASTALWRLWQIKGGATPAVLAGHSLGEYSALVAADVLSLTDAVKLVHARGNYMQSAVPESIGAMAAIIGKTDQEVTQLCADFSTQNSMVEPANFNCNGQVVVAGHTTTIDNLVAQSKALKFRAIKLNVSVPSHCQLMRPAAEKLTAAFESITLHEPKIDVIQNVNARIAQTTQDIKNALLEQLYKPVQWTATLEKLASLDIAYAVECGNGNVLSGLAKRQKTPFTLYRTDSVAQFEAALSQS